MTFAFSPNTKFNTFRYIHFLAIINFLIWIIFVKSVPAQSYQKFQDIQYETKPGVDNNLLSLDIYVPNGGNGLKPVMIWAHAGGWRIGDKTQTRYKDEFFTSLGYIFVSINYRLSPNPPDIFNPERIVFPAHPKDAAKAVRWVYENIPYFGGDTDRIALIGSSSGGHLFSLISTDESYLQEVGLSIKWIKCTCSLDPASYDIPYYMSNYPTAGDEQWVSYINAFGADTAIWGQASPIRFIDENKDIPDFMLVHQGTPERIDLATRFADVLVNNNIPVTLFNTSPYDHNELNLYLGNSELEFQAYNDSVAEFFRDCLSRVVSSKVDNRETTSTALYLFPNPTNGYITLSLQPGKMIPVNSRIMIFNVLGEIVFEQNHSNGSSFLPLQHFNAGVYFLKLHDGKKWFTQKFIKI